MEAIIINTNRGTAIITSIFSFPRSVTPHRSSVVTISASLVGREDIIPVPDLDHATIDIRGVPSGDRERHIKVDWVRVSGLPGELQQ
jgi:hypothetical protein